MMATGIMMAMIDIGPSPGNMPMMVPIRQPATTSKRFCRVKAVYRPSMTPSSMVFLSYVINQGKGLRKIPKASWTKYQILPTATKAVRTIM